MGTRDAIRTTEVSQHSGAPSVPVSSTDLLTLSTARQAIEHASTVGEAKHIRDFAEAARVYAQKARLGLEAQNKAAEIKLRAERKCGEVLISMAERGERAGRGKPDIVSGLATLADLGIDEKQSTRWQKIAKIALAEFERYIANKWALSDEITTAGLLAHHDTTALLSSVSNEWYTPALYVDAARRVMGGIDLDPASCAVANKTVRADRYCTEDDDGLVREWHGRIWLNPPYGGLAGPFVAKLVEEFGAGRTEQAVLLVSVNAAPSHWFQPLLDHLMCVMDHRIHFISPSGTPGTSPHGSVIVYFGQRRTAFAREFRAFGRLVAAWDGGGDAGVPLDRRASKTARDYEKAGST